MRESHAHIFIDEGFAHILEKEDFLPKLRTIQKIKYSFETKHSQITRIVNILQKMGGMFTYFGWWLSHQQHFLDEQPSLKLRECKPIPLEKPPKLKQLLKKEFPRIKFAQLKILETNAFGIFFNYKSGSQKYSGYYIVNKENTIQELHHLLDYAHTLHKYYDFPFKDAVHEFCSQVYHHISLKKSSLKSKYRSKNAVIFPIDHIHIVHETQKLPLKAHVKDQFLDKVIAPAFNRGKMPALSLTEDMIYAKNLHFIHILKEVTLTEEQIIGLQQIILGTFMKDNHLCFSGFFKCIKKPFVYKKQFTELTFGEGIGWVQTQSRKFGVPLADNVVYFLHNVYLLDMLTPHKNHMFYLKRFVKFPIKIQKKQKIDHSTNRILYAIFASTFTLLAVILVLVGTKTTIIQTSPIILMGILILVFISRRP